MDEQQQARHQAMLADALKRIAAMPPTPAQGDPWPPVEMAGPGERMLNAGRTVLGADTAPRGYERIGGWR